MGRQGMKTGNPVRLEQRRKGVCQGGIGGTGIMKATEEIRAAQTTGITGIRVGEGFASGVYTIRKVSGKREGIAQVRYPQEPVFQKRAGVLPGMFNNGRKIWKRNMICFCFAASPIWQDGASLPGNGRRRRP